MACFMEIITLHKKQNDAYIHTKPHSISSSIEHYYYQNRLKWNIAIFPILCEGYNNKVISILLWTPYVLQWKEWRESDLNITKLAVFFSSFTLCSRLTFIQRIYPKGAVFVIVVQIKRKLTNIQTSFGTSGGDLAELKRRKNPNIGYST